MTTQQQQQQQSPTIDFETEIETLLQTAISEENEDGSPMLAAQCYADALTALIRRAQQVGVNDGFFVAIQPKLMHYLDRARLLADIAVDEEKALKEVAK